MGKVPNWTKEEDKIILEAEQYSLKELEKKLPNRTKVSILHRLRKYNVKMKPSELLWKDEEVDFLKNNHLKLTLAEISNKLDGRTKRAIQTKMARLDLSIKEEENPNEWKQEEDDILIENHMEKSISKIMEIMPHRSYDRIKWRMKKLGLEIKKFEELWLPEEDEILIEYCPEITLKELSKVIPNRKINSIRYRINALGLEYRKERYPWDEKEDNKLVELAKSHTVQELCEIFYDRTPTAIKGRLSILKVTAIREDRGRTKTNWIDMSKKSTNFDSYKLYIIEVYGNNEHFYKIGITYTTIVKRFAGEAAIPYNYNIKKIVESSDPNYIWNLEKRLHRKYKKKGLQYIPKKSFNGMYECVSEINMKEVEHECQRKQTKIEN